MHAYCVPGTLLSSLYSQMSWLNPRTQNPWILRVKLFVLTHLLLLVKRFYDYSYLIDEKIKAQRN